ncbi:hypothetical protein HAX54_007695 [Datura stramonium]|uniref:Uncharacterized protein n=1 Tax=Datura stramonium TaxID=4076 RepID=A0ABS8WZI8_DATST|nr:hypothetical protein [Datura stramonium]
MSVFLGHHRNIDRVDDGTKNETLRQLFRRRSLASHTQVLSKLCNKRKVTTSMESWSPLEALAGNQVYRSRNHFGLLSGAFVEANRRNSKRKKGAWFSISGRGVKAIREDCPTGKEEGRGERGAVIYLDQFPEALEIQTGSENHSRYLALRSANKEVILDDFPFLPCRAASSPFADASAFPFYNIPRRPPFQSLRKKDQSKPYLSKASSVIFPPQGSLSDPFPSLPHCSSKCATPYETSFFCPLSVHTVLKAEEEGGQQQRSCECAVMLRMLHHRIDRSSSVLSGCARAWYLRHTRKDAVGRKQP